MCFSVIMVHLGPINPGTTFFRLLFSGQKKSLPIRTKVRRGQSVSQSCRRHDHDMAPPNLLLLLLGVVGGLLGLVVGDGWHRFDLMRVPTVEWEMATNYTITVGHFKYITLMFG